jgi:hypothetical protein
MDSLFSQTVETPGICMRNSNSTCFHSVHKLLSSCLLYKHLKIRIYKTVILSVVLYRCETLSPILRQEYSLRVFENRVLGRIRIWTEEG